MEQAYKLHGDVLAEHGVSKNETIDAGVKRSVSTEKPEEETIV